nr:uncharacterized protein LOC110363298 [Columba livia]XP_021151566.1 uncharacterized protein LOC110363298 [Columba livia]XP_021151570.1 uncharacterized protein LOC110363298 [Columba livia]XP_021151577.1 uncharacterized protein LOC110363298 [Columba livia]XP_021151580.1 uncharacterized protein LOC110363298 [Columba livia]XP_021151586.1 uncharacterized protein LOC110363298 [Columba livia]XP_021151589.1 uncharacterized protein LOC110363298 [Columba livia]XP_021151590.1 uncharacterized protein 
MKLKDNLRKKSYARMWQSFLSQSCGSRFVEMFLKNSVCLMLRRACSCLINWRNCSKILHPYESASPVLLPREVRPVVSCRFWKLKQLRKAISSAGSEAETTDAAEDELTAQSNSPHMPRKVLSALLSSLISDHFWEQSQKESLFSEISYMFSLLQRCNQSWKAQLLLETIFLMPNAPGDIVLLAKPVTLTEGDRVTLTTDVPVATDGTSKPEKLLYAVSLPPVHGQIEHINYPGVPISSYRQLDVVAQKVSYVHDNSHGAAPPPCRTSERVSPGCQEPLHCSKSRTFPARSLILSLLCLD